MSAKALIFTDLDGTLLDHFSYSHAPADPLLTLLEGISIPVIPVTSKTRAELLILRQSLTNHHPFVIENGAAVYIPDGYFSSLPEGCFSVEGGWYFPFSDPRATWISLLDRVAEEYRGEYESFTSLGVEGIIQHTGLTKEQALLANNREFSEPVLWQGDEVRKQQFVTQLRDAGATVLQGGRFLHITGQCNKGKALEWLAGQFRLNSPDQQFITLAAGDSPNDLDMLKAADLALLVRSPSHSPPQLTHSNSYISTALGPEGWVEGVSHFLLSSELSVPGSVRETLRSYHG